MEVLPNEVLLECFKYLDGLDIFHSFNGLNHRFSRLIRSIPLYIDFHIMTTEKYYQTALKLLSNEENKQQIYSLKFTKDNGYQRKLLEKGYFMNGLNYLHSLSLAKDDGYFQIVSHINLSQLSQLNCFYMKYHVFNIKEITDHLSRVPLRILSLSSLEIFDDFSKIITSIQRLTLFNYQDRIVHKLLTDATNLTYLHVVIHHLHEDFVNNDPSTSLRHLSIENLSGELAPIANILKRTVNLKSLTLEHSISTQSWTANDWECFIRCHLPKLKTFNFCFSYNVSIKQENMIAIYETFQTDFWLKEHQWYTSCMLSNRLSMIYTLPYMKDSYTSIPASKTYFNQTIDHHNMFSRVKYLKLNSNITKDKSPCRFSCVTSIDINNCYFNNEYFQSLQTRVNLTTIKILSLSYYCQLEDSNILLELLKHAPNISSLSIDRQMLSSLLDDDNDDELCEYLSNMIKKLVLIENYDHENANDFERDLHQMSKVWETFINIEELTCVIKTEQSIRFLLTSLPNLSNIHITSGSNMIAMKLKSLAQEIARQLRIEIVKENPLGGIFYPSMWIIRKPPKTSTRNISSCFEIFFKCFQN